MCGVGFLAPFISTLSFACKFCHARSKNLHSSPVVYSGTTVKYFEAHCRNDFANFLQIIFLVKHQRRLGASFFFFYWEAKKGFSVTLCAIDAILQTY